MNKIKTAREARDDGDNFFMTLEEARAALSISDKYEGLEDKIERSKSMRKRAA